MNCIICGNEIVGRRSDSKYCSGKCSNKAKKQRYDKRLVESLQPAADTNVGLTGLQELRTVEKDHFATVREMENSFRDQLKQKENEVLRLEFKVERLQDKITDLKEAHGKEVENLQKNATKETIQAISSMPAAQTLLGNLASNLIPGTDGSLGGVENFSEIEKRLIQSLRALPSDLQMFMIQMQKLFYSKTEEEQREMCNMLTSYMSNKPEEDI